MSKAIIREYMEQGLKRDGYKNHSKIIQIFKSVEKESKKTKNLRVMYISNRQLNIECKELDLSCITRIEIGSFKQNVEKLEAQDLNVLVSFFEGLGLEIFIKMGNDIKKIRSF